MRTVWRAITEWGRSELEPVWKLLGYWPIYPVLALGLCLMAAGYQFRGAYPLDIGGIFDGPYVADFNAVESSPEMNFRWSKASSTISFPGIGQDDYEVTIKLVGYRPSPPPPKVEFFANGHSLGIKQTSGVPETITLRVPRAYVASGDLDLLLKSDTFRPEGDARDLGVSVDQITVQPVGNGIVLPSTGQVIPLLVIILVGALLALRLGGSRRVALFVAILLGLAFAILIVFARLWLSVFTDQLLVTFIAAYMVLAITSLIVELWYKRSGVLLAAGARNALLSVFAILFVVRLGGQLYPQNFVMDAVFHVHRLEQVLSGSIYFTIVSGEWGGHSTFYLPTAYLLMAPLTLIVQDKLFLVKLFTVWMDTSGLFLMFFVVFKVTKDARAAFLSALVYVIMPLSFLVFSWGVTTNLFGQWLALAVLALLATCFDRLHRPAKFILLVFTLLLAFLSHPGVVLLLAVSLVVFVVLNVLVNRRTRLEKGTVALVAAGVLAAAIAFGGYYSHFVGTMTGEAEAMAQERQQTAAEQDHSRVFYVGGSVSDRSLDLRPTQVYSIRDLVVQGIKGLYHEARAYFELWPLFGLLFGGLLVFTAYKTSRLGLLMSAWVISAVAFAGVGFLTGLYVRYMLFLLPVAAIGSGIFLARIFPKQWAGQAIALMMVAYILWSGASLWYERVMYAFH
ncbi:MAG: hypothetical protein M1319_01220 [Chloroflexi bacterium]|nr:hypothetical protein [Chloroflexota bacterium]